MDTIIIYSGGSNTTAVAQYMAGKIGCKAATVQDAASLDLGSFDRIIIGTRVRAGKIPSDISDYVTKNKDVILSKSPVFFLCSMYNGEKGQKQVERISSSLGISKCVFFNKGKKIVNEADNPIDAFIASI